MSKTKVLADASSACTNKQIRCQVMTPNVRSGLPEGKRLLTVDYRLQLQLLSLLLHGSWHTTVCSIAIVSMRKCLITLGLTVSVTRITG